MPTTAHVHITASSPVNVSFGSCRADQAMEFDRDCSGYEGETLTVTDSRVPLAALLGQFNRVTVEVTH